MESFIFRRNFTELTVMGNVQPRAFTDHTVHMGISGRAELSEFLWEASPMSATVPAASRRK